MPSMKTKKRLRAEAAVAARYGLVRREDESDSTLAGRILYTSPHEQTRRVMRRTIFGY